MSSTSTLSRRSFLQWSTGITATAALAACAPVAGGKPAGNAPAAQTKTKVLVWDQFGQESAGVDQMVKAFNDANPDIEVTREAQQNIRDILKTALTAGTGPDIMYYDTGPGFAGVLARAGLLLPLDDAYAEYNWKDRILPIARERATFDGKVYGIGNELEFVGVFYNKRIFDAQGIKEPATHNDFLVLCDNLKKARI